MALFDRPVRMPLQTGATALKTLAWSAIVLPFIWAVFPALVIVLMAGDARRRRADDIVFTAKGFELRGGPRDGLAFAWTEIDPQTVCLEMTNELFVKKGDQPARYIQRVVVNDFTLAESAEPQELASLAVIVETIRARLRPEEPLPERAANAANALAATVELCPSCGAPIVPADESTFTCAHCHATGPMPASLRARIHDAAALTRSQAQIEALVRKILARGKASTTNRAVFAFGVLLHASAFGAAYLVYKTHDLAWVPLALAFPLITGGIARLTIAHRRALRDLTTACGAIESRAEGAPPVCRVCYAPLPKSAANDVVVRCVYCEASNVLGVGIGLHRDAQAKETEETELHDVLREQRSGTAWALGLTGSGAALLALGAWLSSR